MSGIVFAVVNMKKAVDELTKRGGRITDVPTDAPWGGKPLSDFSKVRRTLLESLRKCACGRWANLY